MGIILHITGRGDWEEAVRQGCYRPASLAAEGFIHCSTVGQATATANSFFRGRRDLVLLCIDESRSPSPVKYEPPTGGIPHHPEAEPLFPHLYGPLHLEAVIRVVDFPAASDGTFQLPEQVSQLNI